MAFCDLAGDMDLAEEFVKAMVACVLNGPQDDFGVFANFVDKGLEERLRFITERPFERVTYTEAVAILENSGKAFELSSVHGPIEEDIDGADRL